MDNVIKLFQKKTIFTVESAQQILPSVSRITRIASRSVQKLLQQLENIRANNDNDAAIKDLEAKVNSIVEKWQKRITALGGEPKGLWLVDFDNGNGVYCWRYPEPKIAYEHQYHEGFQKREKIKVKIIP